MKFTADHPYANPEAGARKLIEIANSVEAVQDGRIFIEKINGPFLGRAALRTNSAPPSPARSDWAGCGGTIPAPM